MTPQESIGWLKTAMSDAFPPGVLVDRLKEAG
jgi:hypothetical protein